jgi:cobalt-zinc-cadmium efflux system outer membrane protein
LYSSAFRRNLRRRSYRVAYAKTLTLITLLHLCVPSFAGPETPIAAGFSSTTNNTRANSQYQTALTEKQALALFYQRNLDLIAARYSIATSKAREIIAAALPNPVMSLDVYEFGGKTNNNGIGPATSVRIDQLIQTAGKRQVKIQSSQLATQASEEDLYDAVRTFSNAVRKAFYALLLAQKTYDFAAGNIEHYREIQRANRLRLEQGDISESDFLRIKVEATKAQSDLDKAQASLDQARSDLAVLLAWPEDAMAFKARDDWPAATEIGQSRGRDALFARALEQRPDLKAAQLRIEQARRDLSLARKQVIPDVTVGGYYQHDPGNIDINTYGVGVQVPLPLFYRNRGEIDQAAVNLSNAMLQLQQAEQSIRADVFSAYAAWTSSSAVALRFQSEILQDVLSVRDAAELSYTKGATSIIDLIEAERNYKNTMMEYYTALNNQAVAYADLLAAVGEKAKEESAAEIDTP